MQQRIKTIAAQGTALRALFRSYLAVLTLRVVEKLVAFTSVAVLFRHLTVEDMATYSFILSASGAMAIFALPEMKNAVAQSVARGFDGTYRPAVKMAVVTSFLGTFVASLAALVYFYRQESEQIALALMVVAIFFPMTSGLQHWRGYLQGKAEFTKFAVLEGITSSLRACALVAAVLAGLTESVVSLVIIAYTFPAILNIAMTLRYLTVTLGRSKVEPASL